MKSDNNAINGTEQWAMRHPLSTNRKGTDWRSHLSDGGKPACGVSGQLIMAHTVNDPHEAAQPRKGDYWYGVCEQCVQIWCKKHTQDTGN